MLTKQKKKIYIGLVGEKGGGKGTLSVFLQKLLPKKKMVQIRFSDALTETLKLWTIPTTRANYQKLVPMMVDTYGPSTLANIVKFRAENTRADIVVLDGVRWRADVKMLRDLKREGAKSFLIYVTAPAHIRYNRLKHRGEKTGEKNATFKQFMKEEKARTDRYIPRIGKTADITIKNAGTMEEFLAAVKAKLIPLLTKNK